jgi:GNAT superfamily N-acetyltransferase
MESSVSPVEEYLEVDLLALRAHTEEAGDRFDEVQHRIRLTNSLAISEVCEVRRDGGVLAYVMLQPKGDGLWFVTAFNVHPGYRTPGVFRALGSDVIAKIQRLGVLRLQSNVYRTNKRSMEFHRRLGFAITKKNAKAVEFTASASAILSNPIVARFYRPWQKHIVRFFINNTRKPTVRFAPMADVLV